MGSYAIRGQSRAYNGVLESAGIEKQSRALPALFIWFHTSVATVTSTERIAERYHTQKSQLLQLGRWFSEKSGKFLLSQIKVLVQSLRQGSCLCRRVSEGTRWGKTPLNSFLTAAIDSSINWMARNRKMFSVSSAKVGRLKSKASTCCFLLRALMENLPTPLSWPLELANNLCGSMMRWCVPLISIALICGAFSVSLYTIQRHLSCWSRDVLISTTNYICKNPISQLHYIYHIPIS